MILKISIYLSILALLILVMIFGFFHVSRFFSGCKDGIKKIITRKRGEIPVFNMYGVHIFAGRVGCGKTISMVRRAKHIKRLFPKVKIYANFTTDIADGYISSWEDIINLENIDEKWSQSRYTFLV